MHDLRRLRAFHEVAERGSFSAAALELGYAQSVVSHHVAALEAEFGVTLVDRTSRPVRLTPAGEALRGHAVEVLGKVAQAEDALRALTGLQAGTLRLGAFSTACTSFVPPALAAFERAHPGVDVTLEQTEPSDALRRVRAGDLDLAVVFAHHPPDGASDDDGLAWTHLGDDPFRLILPPDHRLTRKRRIQLADLARERFCAPPREGLGQTYHEMLGSLCAEAGFEPRIGYYVYDLAVARALVAAGLGIAVMGQHTIPPRGGGVAVRTLPGLRQPQRTILTARLRHRRVPGVAPMLRLLTEAARTWMRPVRRAE